MRQPLVARFDINTFEQRGGGADVDEADEQQAGE